LDLTPHPTASPSLFFSTTPAPTATSTLSLHDALPICRHRRQVLHREPTLGVTRERADRGVPGQPQRLRSRPRFGDDPGGGERRADRKSTRLNSSHVKISYAVFCLKKKKKDMLEYVHKR